MFLTIIFFKHNIFLNVKRKEGITKILTIACKNKDFNSDFELILLPPSMHLKSKENFSKNNFIELGYNKNVHSPIIQILNLHHMEMVSLTSNIKISFNFNS